MSLLGWLRGLVRGRPAQPVAPEAKPLVMHLLGPGPRARCGAPWTPANPITIELHQVTCRPCWAIGSRERIARIATRR